MRSEKQPHVVGYARVSTESQLENYSIAQQEQRLKAYCQAKDWALMDIYVDGGYSGGNMDRPALKELLAAVRGGGIDAVLVYKLDRLSRSQKDTLLLIEDGFLAHGTDFISINENFDTSTPFGRAMIGMLSVFAQLERDQITERFTMGRVGRSRAGYFHGGGSPPTGYRYTDGLLVIDEYQALQVREAFRLFLSGQSVNGVSRLLSRQYSPSWTPSKVRTVLKNSLYIGKVHFKGQEYPGRHQPIVDRETFQQAGRLLESMAETSGERRAFRAKYLLSGLVLCGSCGSRYAAGHGCYRCYSRSKSTAKYIRDPACSNPNWPIPLLDQLVTRQLRRLLLLPHACEMLLPEKAAPLQPEPERLNQRLAEIAAQQDRLAELYQLGSLPEKTLARRAQLLAAEEAALRAQLEQSPPPELPEGEQVTESFFRGFQRAPVEKRRAFLSALIEKIVIWPDKIVIHWRI